MRISSSRNGKLASLNTLVLHPLTQLACKCADVVIASVPSYKQKFLPLWTYLGFGKFGGPEGPSCPGEGTKASRTQEYPIYTERLSEKPTETENLLLTTYYHSTTCMLSFAVSRSYSVSLVSLCKQREHYKLGMAGAKQHLYTANPSMAFCFWRTVFLFDFCQLTFLWPSDSLTTVHHICTCWVQPHSQCIWEVPFFNNFLMHIEVWEPRCSELRDHTYCDPSLLLCTYPYTMLCVSGISILCISVHTYTKRINQKLFLHRIEGMLRSRAALPARFSFIYWRALFPFFYVHKWQEIQHAQVGL